MIFPVGLIAYLERDRLRRWLALLPFPLAYFAAGVGLGLITESFAILSNLQRPPGERILLHPDPLIDLLFGLVYYSLFMTVWYGLLRRWCFSARKVFVLSGLFGIATEQAGAIMMGAVAAPLTGIPMALIIACIYGIFPSLACLLTSHRFPERPHPPWWAHLVALLCLFLFWAVYGNFVHKGLLFLFPK